MAGGGEEEEESDEEDALAVDSLTGALQVSRGSENGKVSCNI